MAECLIRISDNEKGDVDIEWAWDSPVPNGEGAVRTNTHILGQETIRHMLSMTNAGQQLNAKGGA